MTEQIIIFFQIVFIDLVLAGDNAIIIGMVASQFQADQRKKIIFWGIGAAIVLRIIFTLITAYLLQINGLKLIGGILLLYIVYKLYNDVIKNSSENKKNTLISKWKVNKENFIFLLPGRLTSWKGQDVFIEALNILLLDYNKTNFYAIILGSDQGRNVYSKKLLGLVKKKSLLFNKKIKIKFVKDRPGHDIRYALNSNKTKKKIGWKPKTKFVEGIKNTFIWYLDNQEYYKNISKKIGRASCRERV